LVAAAIVVAACELLPLPQPPPAAVPLPHCEVVADFAEDGISCRRAVDIALAELGDDHPPILAIRFRYGPCGCPDGALCDCALHIFGTVTFAFAGTEPSGASFHVKPTQGGGYVAVRNPDGVP
jgi:hypothetical protein